MRNILIHGLISCCLFHAFGCSSSDSTPEQPATDAGSDSSVPDSASDSSSSDASPDSITDGNLEDQSSFVWKCKAPPSLVGTGTEVVDGTAKATAALSDLAQDPCAPRSYSLFSTAKLRTDKSQEPPPNPLAIVENQAFPRLRSGNLMLDTLYALALQESQQNSVDSIRDASFNDGADISCPKGGCFQTGRLWNYVWTRDTAYSIHLGLAALDPVRAKNSLEFKLSERREGGDLQIVQDTGSGGSYPVSTDRVVWALGALETLKFLDGTERTDFLNRAYDAMKNTAEQDRRLVFDTTDGLYNGEQSFLDWREQSYPYWTKENTVHIAMSKSLSTNVVHARLLDGLAEMAVEKKLSSDATRYAAWATALRSSIRTRFLLEGGQLAAYVPTFLDPAPTRQLDLLATSLAILSEVVDGPDASKALASYPVFPKGPPVIFPQEQAQQIYHNRGIWPFVTAYYLQAAKKVHNDAAANLAFDSLVRGAALNLSNMENFEAVEQSAAVFEGSSEVMPVVDSQRQLWSVAGFASAIQNVIFGLQSSQTGLTFAPYVTRRLRNVQLAGTDRISLEDLNYRGKKVSVVVDLPVKTDNQVGAYSVGTVTLNGHQVQSGTAIQLSEPRNLVEITLLDTPDQASSLNLVSDTASWRNVFGPKTPSIQNPSLASGQISLALDPRGEATADITYTIYRDGEIVAQELPGTTSSFIDTKPVSGRSHCYSMESVFVASKTVSRRSEPRCFWGTVGDRIRSFSVSEMKYTGASASISSVNGLSYLSSWGDPPDTLEVEAFQPKHTGPHLLQITYANGSGGVDSGVACGVKRVQVFESGKTEPVAVGSMVMPQVGSWTKWTDSSFVRVELDSAKTYRILVDEVSYTRNMSSFTFAASYTPKDKMGGASGAFNRVNVQFLKLLSLGGQ